MSMNVYVKHCDNTVAILQLSEDSGSILRVKGIAPELMPFMREMSLKEWNTWWNNRAIPNSRKVEEDNILFMYKNLALSLSDHYWVCPEDLFVSWKEANLYDNATNVTFMSSDGQEFSNDPNGTLNGSLPKKAEYQNGQWKLIKYSEAENGLQSINEGFACLIHQNQEMENYVKYTLQFMDERCISCTSDFFTGRDMEFIPAWNICNSEKKPNDISEYEHYIRLCCKNGIEESTIRDFMDYQTLTDFVITNIDRHLMNYGVLRDPNTLKFIAPAPIFDSGNSMFFRNLYFMKASEILNIKINALTDKEEKMLLYPQDKSLISLAKLPTTEMVIKYYAEHGISEELAAIIGKNYDQKRKILELYMQGYKVSYYMMKERERKS